MSDRMTFVAETSMLEEKVTVSASVANLSDAIEVFERFLRGAGFCFEGRLDFVNDEQIEIKAPPDLNTDNTPF